nr:mannitol dehydrogenase family protein [Spelaeicoccus albus]
MPPIDPGALTAGIVHLGVGAFHRAHQAVYTELAAAATGETRWGIVGATGRSGAVVRQLQPQDGLYGVLTKDAAETSLRIVGSIRQVVSGSRDQEAVMDAVADRRVSVTTLTITEKGYPRDASGGLAVGTDAVTADIEAVRGVLSGRSGGSGSSVGLLTAGLARRFGATQAPISVVSCDNLPGNGPQLARLVRDMADRAGDSAFSEWVRSGVAFPATMVDRIVPATTDGDRAEETALLGLHDEGLVVAEPFGQWVIEDAFAGDRPAWEKAGATVTADVAPFEKAKLRMLNATHCLLAYLGALRGIDTIAGAAADDYLIAAARALQTRDVIPTLDTPPGMDLAEYGESILTRFLNPSLPHTTAQVAMDGSQKLPIRIIATASDRLKAGTVPDACALTLAAWMVFVYRGRDKDGRDLPLSDPLADTLREHAAGSEAGLADRMFAVKQMFPEDVAGHDGFRAAVRTHVDRLLREIP